MMIPRPVVEWPARAASATFYRPKRFIGSALTPSVYVDGRQVVRGPFGPSAVVCLLRPPLTSTAWSG
jgi:hypothetical protein